MDRPDPTFREWEATVTCPCGHWFTVYLDNEMGRTTYSAPPTCPECGADHEG